MKGSFSVEWLAQSSRSGILVSQGNRGPASPTTRVSSPEERLPGCREGLAKVQESGKSPEGQNTGPRGSTCFNPKSDRDLLNNSPVSEVSCSSSEETSGYESEGERPDSPGEEGENPGTGSHCAGRRPRTAFTVEQINKLEKTFNKQKYLASQERQELCRKLNLSEKQIKTWFQNRRMKLKRNIQDALAHACHSEATSPFLQYSELQALGPSPYPGFVPEGPTYLPALLSPAVPYSLPIPSTAPVLRTGKSAYLYSMPSRVMPGALPIGGMVRRFLPYASHY
ncbi:transcription factor LBX2-like [Latimeria chalumnae]|uniref:transcription factor LBX2-like n=1 Tax=Latimeria chalumnae TaxID=7897 RepID=UPI00313D0BCA